MPAASDDKRKDNLMWYDPRTEKHGLKHSPVTALVVPRPIGWISTLNAVGKINLAPYSFFNMISGYPPWLMFSSAPKKNSQTNAELTGEFTFSLATWSLREVMNASSAEFPPDISEPEAVGIESQQAGTGGQRLGVLPLSQEIRRTSQGGDGRLGLTPDTGTEDAAQPALAVLAVHRDQRRVVEVLPEVDVGVARHQLALQGIGRRLSPPSVHFHARSMPGLAAGGLGKGLRLRLPIVAQRRAPGLCASGYSPQTGRRQLA